MKAQSSFLIALSWVAGLSVSACTGDDPVETASVDDAGADSGSRPKPKPEPEPEPEPVDAGQDAAKDAADSGPDLQIDPMNCGAVGKVCGAPRTCTKGECSRLVFVTSTTYDGALAGVVATTCGTRANAASLSGTYKPWVSQGSGADPKFTFTKSNAPYQLVDGTVVADDFASLISGPLKRAIDKTESGAVVAGSAWTATNSKGEYANVGSCTAFTSSNPTVTGVVGAVGAVDQTWSRAAAPLACNTQNRLYCFEQ